jgi:CheY-like chemotaxis protein
MWKAQKRPNDFFPCIVKAVALDAVSITLKEQESTPMSRPCFIVVDREYAANISTRKLIIETAKFNVITAYSGREAIETVERFPAVDGVVMDGGVRDMPAADVIHQIKKRYPKIPVILICAPGPNDCREADHHLEFFDPASLLELLQNLLPRETEEIQDRNQQLSAEEEGQ